MNKAFLLILSLIILNATGYAQQTNRVDAQGRKQGKWTKTYSNGSVRYTGQFHNNIPCDTFRYYFPTGAVKAISVYSDSGHVVYTKTFRLNGKPLAKGKFTDRKKDSTWVYYDNLTGSPVMKESYSRGIKDGKSTVYFPDNGRPAEITHYKNGHKNGLWIKYFPSGKVLSEGTYNDDTLNGPFKVNYPNGITEMEGRYQSGLQDGLWVTRDTTGAIIKKQHYNRGVPVKK